MLLAVEGGGFFSSSASGYTNGLALLLFGRRNEEPMKVSPWNRYQLVEQEFELEPQSTARKTQNSRGCARFNCFGCAHVQLDRHSPSAVSLVNQSETHTETASSDTSKTSTTDALNKSDKKPCLKNNLKKPSRDCSATCEVVNANELSEQVENETSCSTTLGRKVQWTDKCGKELAEIREFELSDYGLSDEEFNQENFRRCDCVIQ